MNPITHRVSLALAGTLTLALSACSLSSGEPSSSPASTAAGSTQGTPSSGHAKGTVVLVTHDSFVAPKKTLEAFTKQTGYQVEVRKNGDAGELTNKLVLTKDSPLGDAVFGIDNTFASRAVDAGVLADHTPTNPPAGMAPFALPDPKAARQLTPVDYGDVCVNIDDRWFAKKGINPPKTLDDLTKPAYKNLFVTPGAATSSPGLAFLLATIGKYGEQGWQDYWKKLMANGTRITQGWSDAYSVDFSGGEGKGSRPIVLSYASSPPFTIPKGGDKPTTSALLDTCFRQIEYAGVLKGAKNPAGAAALVDFLVSPTFQKTVPDNMYVYPVNDSVSLPPLWAKWAKVAKHPFTVAPKKIAKDRRAWLEQWSEIATG
jgi:thiamine transport system substrate-binding protein